METLGKMEPGVENPLQTPLLACLRGGCALTLSLPLVSGQERAAGRLAQALIFP